MDQFSFRMPGTVPPPPMGQHPPQFFGGGGYGGDGLQHLPPDVTAQMFSDSHMYYDDPQDPKRRRIARVRDHYNPVGGARKKKTEDQKVHVVDSGCIVLTSETLGL